ncbi:MAG: hypothetical protein A2163_01475 [Actinobacteria bacterium RBG_13_35_12]|nr:MAG: hypothetical protein A2163_01475 [Actinobacteria bacterium RBG_13_35_12]
MKTSIIILTFNRKKDLEENIKKLLQLNPLPDEIIVIDNNSTDNIAGLFQEEITSPLVRYVKLDKNMGVSGGRNYGVEISRGNILIFIDDDAILEPEDAIKRIVNKFKIDPHIGILTFKIINYYTKTIQKNEFPHINKSLNPDRDFETSYFIGAGHVIKKEIFNQCGLYPEDYFYGLEELDLSFRAIDRGHKIVYFPEVVVWHKKSSTGRMSDKKKWTYLYRNRLAISFKYLKYRHLVVISIIWFLKILKESSSVFIPFKGLFSFFSYKKKLKREPISNTSLKKIKSLKGRIWF